MCPVQRASLPSDGRRILSSIFTLKRSELARYGLTIDQANDIVMSAIGGENVTTTVEGRERYPVKWYFGSSGTIWKLRRVLVPVQRK
jgi:Cu(I)/Ag(I) efflux system membrane protein CusA/SilA